MEQRDGPDLAEIIRQSDAIRDAIQRAVREMLTERKKLGQPVVFCDLDGVRLVPADEIVIPDEPAAPQAR